MPDLSVKQHRNDMHSNQERETYFSSFYEILKYFFKKKHIILSKVTQIYKFFIYL